MSTPRLPARAELDGLEPYGAPQFDVAVRLNVNENPYPPPPVVAEAMAAAVRTAATSIHRYPDREAIVLRESLAAYLGHGLTAPRIWAANGSNEIMLQILQAFGGPGRTAMSFVPTYSMYSEYARGTSTRWRVGRRDEQFGIDPDHALEMIEQERPDVVFLASPNNPTGGSLGLDVIKTICAAAPGVVVVDEAYAEFCQAGTPSALTLLDDFPALAVTRTMSKAFGFAGGRVGYLAASPSFVDLLRVVRLPYHLSSVTQAVAKVALEHADVLLERVEDLRAGRDAVTAWLRGQGLTVADSDANFVLFGTFPDPHVVWQRILDKGVLIRESGPQGWLRVSIGTPQDMAGFRAALVDTLAEPQKGPR